MQGEGGSCGDSAIEYSCAHGSPIYFEDLTPYRYLTYGRLCLSSHEFVHPLQDATLYSSVVDPDPVGSETFCRIRNRFETKLLW
jgi:hypothetical protein